jgi:ATP-dependent DNA helicase PIF1
LQFIILDEVLLVGARMLNAINQRLRSIEHVQNKFFGGLDVIVTSDFYQAPPIREKWVFKRINEGLNAIAPNIFHINCYELNIVMRQIDLMFINILNIFKRIIHSIEDIDIINDVYLKEPPKIRQFLVYFILIKK